MNQETAPTCSGWHEYVPFSPLFFHSFTRSREGPAVVGQGCCEGEEGESFPPVPGVCSQLAGKDMAPFPAICFHSWSLLRSFFLLSVLQKAYLTPVSVTNPTTLRKCLFLLPHCFLHLSQFFFDPPLPSLFFPSLPLVPPFALLIS